MLLLIFFCMYTYTLGRPLVVWAIFSNENVQVSPLKKLRLDAKMTLQKIYAPGTTPSRADLRLRIYSIALMG